MTTDEFDYVVVGAGSAGCVLAARLTEDPDVTVLLLEAGGPADNPNIDVPAAGPALWRTAVDWNFTTVPQKHLRERALYWPRGKVLGGSSAINAMIYIRGNRADYDEWHALGNAGWGYDDVLPWFKRAEDNARGADEFHGAGGPLRVEDPRWVSELGRAFLAAAQEAGLPGNTDFNGAHQDGVGVYQVTQRKGMRWSTFRAYLEPAMARPNLTVHTHALTHRVVIEGGRAVGVEFSREGQVHTARAAREVLLCGGAVASPHLLLLSGVGPADHLRESGVPVTVDLPGVGGNLQDHLVADWSHRCERASLFEADRSTGNVLAYLTRRRGPLTSVVAEVGGFTRTLDGLDAPDLQIHFLPALVDELGARTPHGHGWTIWPTLLKPLSAGTVRLRSTDPRWAPAIDPNYLEAPEDVDVLVRGLELSREIAAQPAMRAHLGERFHPPAADEPDLAEYVRRNCQTLFHPVGTCRMGTDALAVVDPQLRVHGVERLRVVDASVMPTVPRGNTNAPTIMVAEQAADLIRSRTLFPI